MHPSVIQHWKRAPLDGASGVFEGGNKKAPEVDEAQLKGPRRKIGELAVGNADLRAYAAPRRPRKPADRPRGERQVNAAAHVSDADLLEAQYQQSCQGAQVIPLPVDRFARGAVQLGLVARHHLSPHAARLPIPRGDHELPHPKGADLAPVQHDGGRVLCRRVVCSNPAVRIARDHE